MSFYVQLLRQRARQALTSLIEHVHHGRDLAAVIRELANNLHLALPVELRTEAPKESIDSLRQRVRLALTSLLAVERAHWARELAMIFRELADELVRRMGEAVKTGRSDQY